MDPEVIQAQTYTQLHAKILETIVLLYKNLQGEPDNIHRAKMDKLYSLYLSEQRESLNEDCQSVLRTSVELGFFIDEAIIAANHLPVYADMIAAHAWMSLRSYDSRSIPNEIFLHLDPTGQLYVKIEYFYSLVRNGEDFKNVLDAPASEPNDGV